MLHDRIDRLLALTLLAVIAGLALILLQGASGGESAGKSPLARAMERELAYQAKVSLLGKIYGPAERLLAEGQDQQALLQLDALQRQYPGEAHGHILKGEILYRMGVLEEAAASFVQGVRLNGNYLEETSPLSRRTEIRQLVEEGLQVVGARARNHPDNPSFSAALKDLYYLKSRLAGGCE